MTQHYLHVQSPVKQKAVEAFDREFSNRKRVPVKFQSEQNERYF